MLTSFSRLAPRALLFLAALGCAAAFSGCGFHLRGPQPLAVSTLHVNVSPYSQLGIALRRQVALSGSTVIEENASKAEAKLLILSNERGREILSLTATGKVREYELTQTTRFSLVGPGGEELIPPTSLSARREYTFDDEQILGKEQEEALLYQDMEDNIVRQIMRRLAAWQRP